MGDNINRLLTSNPSAAELHPALPDWSISSRISIQEKIRHVWPQKFLSTKCNRPETDSPDVVKRHDGKCKLIVVEVAEMRLGKERQPSESINIMVLETISILYITNNSFYIQCTCMELFPLFFLLLTVRAVTITTCCAIIAPKVVIVILRPFHAADYIMTI